MIGQKKKKKDLNNIELDSFLNDFKFNRSPLSPTISLGPAELQTELNITLQIIENWRGICKVKVKSSKKISLKSTLKKKRKENMGTELTFFVIKVDHYPSLTENHQTYKVNHVNIFVNTLSRNCTINELKRNWFGHWSISFHVSFVPIVHPTPIFSLLSRNKGMDKTCRFRYQKVRW